MSPAPLDNLSGKSPDESEAMCRCAFPDPVEYDGVAGTGNGIAPNAWVKFWCDVCLLDIAPIPARGAAETLAGLGTRASGEGSVAAHDPRIAEEQAYDDGSSWHERCAEERKQDASNRS